MVNGKIVSIALVVFSFFVTNFNFGQDTVKYAWPFPPFNQSQGINGTFCEFRNTLSADHFHNAVDIGQPDGAPVYPCIDGTVYYIDAGGSNAYVSVKTKIGNKWKRITYLHINPSPKMYIGKLVKAGRDTLGFIHSGMGHTHLIERELVNSPDDYAVEINNIRKGGGLTPYVDNWPPVIHENTLQFRLNGTTTTMPANALSNKVDIIVKIEEWNGPSYVHRNNGTYIAGYRVWTEDTSQVVYEPADSGKKYQFDRKPLNEDVHNVFLAGVATTSNPVYILTNGKGERYVNTYRHIYDNYFDTQKLPEGNYQLEIFSKDTRDNFAHKFIPITITRRDVIAPGIVTLLAVLNEDGKKSVKVMWQKRPEPDIKAYRLYYTGNTLLQDWKLAAEMPGDTSEYSFNSPAEFVNPTDANVYFFYITAVDSSGNESKPSDIYSRSTFQTAEERPNALIVDGFDRYGGSGSWNKPTHSFNTKYFMAMTVADNQLNISSCANDAVEKGLIDLNDYDFVVWFCGDESTKDNTFTTKEQGKIAEYLINGGNIFVTGSEIGWDLDKPHSGSVPSDTLFYRHYLHAKFVYDGDRNMNKVYGRESTVFENFQMMFGQTYPEDYPDDINPLYGSQIILDYNTNRLGGEKRHAGVFYKGTFAQSDKIGSVVYVAFGFESSGSLSKQSEFFNDVFKLIDLKTAVKKEKILPLNFALEQNYPNPFPAGSGTNEPTTTIKYSIPYVGDATLQNAGASPTNVRLVVYDVLGRKVATLVNKRQAPGKYSVQFNARNLASGIYFYRLTYGQYSLVKKMILQK